MTAGTSGRGSRAESPDRPLRRQAFGLSLAAGLLALLCGWRALAASSLEAELRSRSSRAAALANDAAAIAKLREQPRLAAESGLPVADLLDKVGRALKSAGIEPASLVSTMPQPARRTQGARHLEVASRLIFEKIRLESLVRFCVALTSDSPQLHVTGIQLHSAAEAASWNAELTVSYYVTAPTNEKSGGPK